MSVSDWFMERTNQHPQMSLSKQWIPLVFLLFILSLPSVKAKLPFTPNHESCALFGNHILFWTLNGKSINMTVFIAYALDGYGGIVFHSSKNYILVGTQKGNFREFQSVGEYLVTN